MLTSINKSKHILLEKFLTSLGIAHLGSESAALLAKILAKNKISKPSEIIKHIQNAEIDKISGFGPKVVASIREYFSNKDKIDLLKKFDECGITIKSSELTPVSSKLTNKIFVLTGVLDKLTRREAKDKIEQLGGKLSENVTKKTDFVVVGKDFGSKYHKALKLGIKIINEKEFLNILYE